MMLKRNTNLIVKLLLIVIFVGLLVVIFVIAGNMETANSASIKVPARETQRKVLIDSPKLYTELDYVCYFDPEPTEEYLSKVRASICKLESINKDAYTTKARNAMAKELVRLKGIETRMASDLTKYLKWEEEHYYAAKTWEFLRKRDFSQEVTCGIIGNMMIETSGGSLNLKPEIYSPSGNYYGLCQWSRKYYPEAHGLAFEHQLDYLLGSMQWEFNTFGKNYENGFKYDDFLKMTDSAEAALAFAKSYERCGPASYEMRQKAAVKAYEYFDLNS